MAPKGKKGQAQGTGSGVWIAGGVAAVLLLGGLVYVALKEETPATSSGYTPVSTFSHIHGIAVNPSNPREIFLATHHGLIHGLDDGNWARVGANTDDFMGFTVHPTNGSTLWSSGHPGTLAPGESPNLGVRLSRDGGHTWNRIALPGVDFHAMTVSPAAPDTLWGYAAGKLHRSQDAGHTWNVVSTNPPPLLSLTPDPQRADTLYASLGARGAFRSADGGVTWYPFRLNATNALALDPTSSATMYAASGATVEKSTDGGATWIPLAVPPTGSAVLYLAVDPTNVRTLYAVTAQSAILKTTDGGATWAIVKSAS